MFLGLFEICPFDIEDQTKLTFVQIFTLMKKFESSFFPCEGNSTQREIIRKHLCVCHD